jgi:hypothetical protein
MTDVKVGPTDAGVSNGNEHFPGLGHGSGKGNQLDLAWPAAKFAQRVHEMGVLFR